MSKNFPEGSAGNGEARKSAPSFSSEELQELEDLLLNRRAFLLGNVQRLEDQAFRDGAEERSGVPIHPAELATDNYLLDMSLAFIENESGRLQEIDDALERLRDGSFGRCEGCDEVVAIERLRAVPYARFCVHCQTAQEQS
jgi:RNA polymerase-binding transcription factor DksA